MKKHKFEFTIEQIILIELAMKLKMADIRESISYWEKVLETCTDEGRKEGINRVIATDKNGVDECAKVLEMLRNWD